MSPPARHTSASRRHCGILSFFLINSADGDHHCRTRPVHVLVDFFDAWHQNRSRDIFSEFSFAGEFVLHQSPKKIRLELCEVVCAGHLVDRCRGCGTSFAHQTRFCIAEEVVVIRGTSMIGGDIAVSMHSNQLCAGRRRRKNLGQRDG